MRGGSSAPAAAAAPQRWGGFTERQWADWISGGWAKHTAGGPASSPCGGTAAAGANAAASTGGASAGIGASRWPAPTAERDPVQDAEVDETRKALQAANDVLNKMEGSGHAAAAAIAAQRASVDELSGALQQRKPPGDKYAKNLKVIEQLKKDVAKCRERASGLYARIDELATEARAADAKTANAERALAAEREATAGLAEAAGAEPPPSELAKATGTLAEAFASTLAGLSAEDAEKLAPAFAMLKEQAGLLAPTAAAATAVTGTAMQTDQPPATEQQQAPREPAPPAQASEPEPSATAPPPAQTQPSGEHGAPAAQAATAGSTLLPAGSATPASAATEERARIASELCQSDSHYVRAQKSELRGRLHVRPNGEEELQTAIAEVLKARQQQDEDEARAATISLGPRSEAPAANLRQPPAVDDDEFPLTPTAPSGKRGRRLDAEGRDAGDDSGMATTSQENSGAPP